MSRITAHSNDVRITGGSSAGGTYTAARNGDVVLYSSTADFIRLGQNYYPYYVYRGFLQFDTSVVALTDTIVAAFIGLKVKSDQSYTDFTINLYAYDWKEVTTNPIAQDVFDLGTAGSRVAAAAALMEASSGTSGKAAGSWHYLNWTVADLAANRINKGVGAYSRFAVRSSRDIANTAPGGGEYQDLYTANASTASYRPYLDITHQAGGVVRISRIYSDVLNQQPFMPLG